jgi:hypothetical protein
MRDTPKHTKKFILVCPGFDPDTNPCDTWNPYPNQKEALADRDGAEFYAPGNRRRVIVQVGTTYTIVDDGGFGEM